MTDGGVARPPPPERVSIPLYIGAAVMTVADLRLNAAWEWVFHPPLHRGGGDDALNAYLWARKALMFPSPLHRGGGDDPRGEAGPATGKEGFHPLYIGGGGDDPAPNVHLRSA